MDIKKLKAEFEEVKASAEKRLEKIKAFDESGSSIDIHDVYRIVYDETEYMYRNMDRIWEALYSFAQEHTKNHAPHPKSAAQMNKAVKAFGMEEDIEVGKKTVVMAGVKSHQKSLAEFLNTREKTETEKKIEDYLG